MESLTYFHNIKVSPKKLRFLLPAIKKHRPAEALEFLMYSPQKTGKIFYKAIQSAIANAKNTLKVNDDVLKFKLFTVEEGQKLKRYQPNARGTARPILKRFSHIKIILTAEEKLSSKKVDETKKPANEDKKESVVSKSNTKNVEKEDKKEVKKSKSRPKVDHPLDKKVTKESKEVTK